MLMLMTGLQSSWLGTLGLLGLETLPRHILMLPALSLRFLSLQEGLTELSVTKAPCVCSTCWNLRGCVSCVCSGQALREDTMSQGGKRKYQ